MNGADLLAAIGEIDEQYVCELLESTEHTIFQESGEISAEHSVFRGGYSETFGVRHMPRGQLFHRSVTAAVMIACVVLSVGVVGKALSAYRGQIPIPQTQETTVAETTTLQSHPKDTTAAFHVIGTDESATKTETTADTTSLSADTEITPEESTVPPITGYTTLIILSEPLISETPPPETTVVSSESDTMPELTTTTTTVPILENKAVIVLKQEPTKTVYLVGQPLDLTGGMAYAGDAYEATGLKPLSEFEIDATAFDNTQKGIYPIYVKWHDAQTVFYVKVLP